MRNNRTFIILALIVVAAWVGPWISAYQGDKAMRYHYGKVDGQELECVAVDGTHFDRYACLILDSKNSKRVNYDNGKVLLDGEQVHFPHGQNVGWLKADGQIQFSAVSPQEITAGQVGGSEVYYILGKVPKFKRFPFGVPRIEFLQSKFQIKS